MTNLFKNFTGWSGSPAKTTADRDNRAQSEEQTVTPRGLKRKADPYDFDAQDPAADGARLRVASEAPDSSPRVVVSASKSKRHARSPFKQVDEGDTDRKQVARRAKQEGPIADSIDAAPQEDLKHAVADADAPAIVEAVNKLHNDEEDQQGVDSEASVGRSRTGGRAPEAPMGTRVSLGRMTEETEVEVLLSHRWDEADDKGIQVLVKWADEPIDDATWEPEAEIQAGAAETLYEYWDKLGGRSEVLFYKDGADREEEYHVFEILSHEKRQPGGFFLEVQWVGYPKTRGNTTMEPEAKLKKTAPEILAEYWEKRGGRSKYLSARGRGKKTQD